MTRVLLVLGVVGATVFEAGRASAQPPLPLGDAVATALAQSRPLRTARSMATEAESRVTEVRAGLFPTINVAETWQRGNQPVFVFSSLLASRRFAASNFAIDALNHPDPQGFFQTTVGVEQLLFDGGRVRSMVRAASLQRDIAQHATDEAEAGIVVAVTQAYGRLLAAQAARRAAESGVEAAQEDLERIRARRDAGMAAEADVLSLAVHRSDLEQRMIQADGDVVAARAELNRLMGSPIDRDFEAVAPAGPDAAAPVPPLETLLTEARTHRPELRRAASAEALSDVVRQQARTALVPQVGAQAAFEVSGTSFNDRASSWIVGGSLRWSFSTGGADLARLRANAEASSRARIDREETRAAVEVDVVTARRRVESARARQAVGRAAVDQARESQRMIRDRFDAGLATVTDVLRASAAVLETEAQQTGALVDAVVSQALLEKAVGRASSARPATTAAPDGAN
jgi:outer membrane protein TolC